MLYDEKSFMMLDTVPYQNLFWWSYMYRNIHGNQQMYSNPV